MIIINIRAGLPIQLFCVISTKGEFTPVRFRYMDDDQCVHSVRVSDVISQSRTKVFGKDTLCYRCHTEWDGEVIPVEIRYDIIEHKWTYLRRLDAGF